MAKTTYVWDELSDNVIDEYEDGVLSVSYDHEPGLYGNLLSENRNGIISYYHYDGRGDTVALTDDSGNVTDTKEYDAWGNVIASTESTVTPYQFVGRNGYEANLQPHFTYVRARYFQPDPGRWTSGAQMDFPAGANEYSYVANNAVMKSDPSGSKMPGDFAAADPATCNIALRCGPASSGQQHCGLVISGHPDYPGRAIGLDGSGGHVTEILIEDPVKPYGTTGPFTPFSAATCKCLTSHRIKWNKLELPRNHMCNNSNFTLKCLLDACSLKFKGTPPIGYNCQICVEWRGSHGCLSCAEWRELTCSEFIKMGGGATVPGYPNSVPDPRPW